jgi:hypothetical protein
MERLLWRLVLPSTPRDADSLSAGLQLHLAHSALTSVLIQIGGKQQAYAAMRTCASCRSGRHSPGCRVTLLTQLLRAHWDEQAALTRVPLGLACRPYTRMVYARPARGSAPLAEFDLAAWSEARLVEDWQSGPRSLITAALLAVASGPDPVARLREHGWRAYVLPGRLGLRLAHQPIPGVLWFGGTWSDVPMLLTPQTNTTPANSLAAAAE